MPYDLNGRMALITGATQGLGRAIAEAYIHAGASVAICARDRAAVGEAQSQLARLAGNGSRVIAQVADVADQQDVEEFVDRTINEFGRIDVLVSNAGIYGPLGTIDEIDWSEWARTIEINLLGSVFVCRAVVAHMKQNRAGKIIQLSGGGATNPLPNISAYAASKAAVVRFAETLAEEVRAFGIDVNSIAPGALNTRLLDEVLAAGPERVGPNFYKRSLEQKESGGAGFERGAELAVFLASRASDGLTGKLISAVWDPWKEFPQHRNELQKSDVYTLRRIVPKDRGLPWGVE